jgi:hypothetical protein
LTGHSVSAAGAGKASARRRISARTTRLGSMRLGILTLAKPGKWLQKRHLCLVPEKRDISLLGILPVPPDLYQTVTFSIE